MEAGAIIAAGGNRSADLEQPPQPNQPTRERIQLQTFLSAGRWTHGNGPTAYRLSIKCVTKPYG